MHMAFNKPGLYYIEKDVYVPIRGTCWSAHALVVVLIANKMITNEIIKQVVYSSLTVQLGIISHISDFMFFFHQEEKKRHFFQ